MIGKDESKEEVIFKVNDRRKFNPDGSLREGVEITPAAPPKEEIKAEEKTASASAAATAGAVSAPSAQESAAEFKNAAGAGVSGAESSPVAEDREAEEQDDLPGADDPASFVNFLSTLATNAAAALGAMPHPVTGQRTLDLDTGKYWIDVLAMLKEKTKNNLHPKETELFEAILGDLRMQYVQMMRLTEEKLKKQAAQKFSAGDILGRK
jgi:hypothetical protein